MHYTFISLKDGVAFVFALKFLGERKATYIKKKKKNPLCAIAEGKVNYIHAINIRTAAFTQSPPETKGSSLM